MGQLHLILRKFVMRHNLRNGCDLHTANDFILCALTFWFVVVSRYLMRIWSRQPDCWCRPCTLESGTWPSHIRLSPASRLVSCVLWIQAAHICLKIFNMKIARLLKVNLRNWI